VPFHIRIFSFGRSNPVLDSEIFRYSRLVGPYASLLIEYVKARGRRGDGDERVLDSNRLGRGCTVALSQEGRSLDSAGFAQWLDKLLQAGREPVFYIGGAYGLSESFKNRCSERISLSRLTFSHSIALLVLTEQIYRAFTILKGHPYHK
jgi:rRNA large subunit m3Psi methyltransferase RlmH